MTGRRAAGPGLPVRPQHPEYNVCTVRLEPVRAGVPIGPGGTARARAEPGPGGLAEGPLVLPGAQRVEAKRGLPASRHERQLERRRADAES